MKTRYKIINTDARKVEMIWNDDTLFHKLNVKIIKNNMEIHDEVWFVLQIEECERISFARPKGVDSMLCEILHNDKQVVDEVLLKLVDNMVVEFDIKSEIVYTEV